MLLLHLVLAWCVSSRRRPFPPPPPINAFVQLTICANGSRIDCERVEHFIFKNQMQLQLLHNSFTAANKIINTAAVLHSALVYNNKLQVSETLCLQFFFFFSTQEQVE